MSIRSPVKRHTLSNLPVKFIVIPKLSRTIGRTELNFKPIRRSNEQRCKFHGGQPFYFKVAPYSPQHLQSGANIQQVQPSENRVDVCELNFSNVENKKNKKRIRSTLSRLRPLWRQVKWRLHWIIITQR